MRYQKGHKEATRQKIVEVAAAEFRKEGITGIGVVDVMARAGLTHGGFYSHFSSKDELVREAIEEAGHQSRLRGAARDSFDLEQMIRHYLRPEHRDHPEKGCAIACLAGEVGRQPKATREKFTTSLEGLLARIEERLSPDQSPAERKRIAQGLLATLVGALQLARAVTDPALSAQFLETGIASALQQARL